MFTQVLWNSPRALPLAVAAAVVVAVAVVWLYPPQVKGLAWHWRLGLPLLRAAGLVTLAAALLKPSVLRPKTGDEQGAVLVLVDRSRSMSVSDNARTAAQLVALADGMGRLSPGVRGDAAGVVAARAAEARPAAAALERAWGDLDYARVAGRGVEAARQRVETAAAHLRDAAARVSRAAGALGDAGPGEWAAALSQVPAADAADAPAQLRALRAALDAAVAAAGRIQAAADERLYQSDPNVKAACDGLARSSRFALVEEALLRPETGLLPRLAGQVTVVGFGVGEALSPLPLHEGLAAPTTRPTTVPVSQPTSGPAPRGSPPPTPGLSITPDGRRSDLAGSIRAALDLYANRDVAAVVLLSDGRQAGAEAAVTSGLGASGVPIYAVAAAPPDSVRDLSLASVTAPASAIVGETITVRAEVAPWGFRDGEAQVRLVAGGEGEQIQAVKFSGGRPATAEFQLRLSGASAAQSYTVSVTPLDGEATVENNEVRRWVKVLSQKVNVAAFAALPGWDYQYLRNALARTRWVELQSAVLNPVSPRVPLSPEQILRQDVLVLADAPLAALDEAQWDAAYRMVSERGGSVILLAGPAHVPVEYGPHVVASSLLPYPPEYTPTWRLWPGEEAMFRLVPHPDVANESLLRIGRGGGGGGGGGALSGAQRWQMLPGFYRVLPVARLKPAARELLVEASSGEPVLTEMRVGAGRAFLVGADETWRWRSRGGDDVHDRFWLQLVRHAAGEQYAVRSERLALDVDRVSFDPGDVVQARVRTLSPAAAPGAAPRLEVVRDDKPYRTLELAPAGGAESGRFRARVGPLAEGRYELRLSEAAEGAAGGEGGAIPAGSVALPLHVTASYHAELADVSGDESLLTRLAEASGGEVFRLEQMDRLAQRLRTAGEKRSRYVEQRLWDSPYLFVFVVGCFAAEWAARKRLGLA